MELFKNILLPVDFSVNTEMEIMKAIELIQPGDAVIHLLHVTREQWPSEMERKLQQWKTSIEETVEDVTVKVYLLRSGSVQNNIIQIAKQIGQGLIIIGDCKGPELFPFFKTLNPNFIAKTTKCAVLVVRPGSIHNKIKSIVMPVRDFIPTRKIEMAAVLAKKYRSKIFLVTLANKKASNPEASQRSFLQTYRMLDNLGVIVSHHVLRGDNLAKASLAFANDIGADMILVNPITETMTDSFIHRNINDLLSKYSKLQILSVEPYPMRQTAG